MTRGAKSILTEELTKVGYSLKNVADYHTTIIIAMEAYGKQFTESKYSILEEQAKEIKELKGIIDFCKEEFEGMENVYQSDFVEKLQFKIEALKTK